MIFVSERIDVTAWEELIAQSSTANFFQTKECYDFSIRVCLFSRSYCIWGYRERMFERNSGWLYTKGWRKTKTIFLAKSNCDRWSLAGRLISSDKASSALLTYCRNKLNKKAIYIEFRNFKDYSLYRDVFRENDFEYIPHLNFHIDCSSEEVIQKNLHSSKKRDIKAGFRKGAILVDSPSLDEVREYISDFSRFI